MLNINSLNIINTNKIKKENIYEIGLAFLRVILSFNVIISHCCKLNINKIITEMALCYHVRIFTIMSFYFSYKTLSSFNIKKISRRFQRLLIPYIIWPLIIFFLNKTMLNKFIRVRIYTFKDLKQQLLTASIIMPIFWYQWNMIFITFLFVFIIFLFRKNNKFIFLLLAISSNIFQYNGNNIKFVSNYAIGYEKYTFGRVLELIPYSVTGLFIASYDIMNYFKNFRFKTILICIYSLYFLTTSNIFIENRGFLYAGLKFYLDANIVFFLFAMFPSENIKNKKIKRIINIITGHTGGIYYLHLSIYEYLYPYFISLRNNKINGCIIIYLICYFICFFGNLIFGKTKLRNLFE